MTPTPKTPQAEPVPHGIRLLATALSAALVVVAYVIYAVVELPLGALALLVLARPAVTVPAVIAFMRLALRNSRIGQS
jgi:hypothetical protein